MDKPTSLFITHLRLLAALWLVMATAAVGLAQNGPIESGSGEFVPEIPASYSGSGSFFNRQLGTAFRFSYHNEGYGTQDGVVTLGTMKVFNQEGSTIFLDGHATLSDGFGGGFNTGIGYRELANLGFGPDPRRIHGISFWADGQSTSADNFFSQLGVAVESLGDSYDLRFQGNFPLERIKDGDRVDVSGATPMFEGDALMGDLQRFARDTALTVIDLEGAKRILDLEAWAFLGGYHLTGGGMDATGYRAGVRGYAVPDVSVSLQVTDDDIYHTNVVFGVTWFVGRTNRCNEPCGTLLDRFREPVLRNDYIATTQQIIDDPINPLSDALTNEQFVFVHVDRDAPAGGDGTIENPYNNLADAEAGSSEDNIVFVHSFVDSSSDLAGNFATKDGQRVLGEGLDPNGIFIDHIVNSAEQGLVSLPESSPGSQSRDAPTINGMGMVFDLADHTGNEVNNFVINGGVTAVSANLADSPHLANLVINGPTGDAISFVGVTGNSLIENSVTIDGAVDRAIYIEGGSGVIGANAVINNATDFAVEVTQRDSGSVTFGEITDTGLGVFVHDNSGGTITFSSLVELDTGANPAVHLSDNEGTTITFQELQATSSGVVATFLVEGGGTISVNDPNSSIVNTGAGSALVVRGGASATGDPSLTVLADIMNSGGGQAVDIQDMTGGAVSITGDVTDNDGTGDGILVQDNTGGTFSFAGITTLDTGANRAVTLRNNEGATVTFSNLNATAAGADTFVVEGGGTINVNDPNDTAMIANTGGGAAVRVRGDVNFDGDPTVNIAADVVNSVGGMSVDIQEMTDGGVTFSGLVDDTDGGVLIQNNTGGTFIFTDTLTVNTGSSDAVSLMNNTGATLSFNGLDITATGGSKGFSATGGGDLTVSNTNPTTISSAMGTALELDGMTISAGNVTFDMVTQTAGDPNSTGVILRDLDGTGSVTVGADTTTPGLITSSGGGVLIDGGANNITVNSDITVNNDPNNSGGHSLEVINRTGGTVLVNSEINDSETGMRIADNTGGAVNITDALMFNTDPNNDAITISGNDGGAIDFTGTSSINLDANSDGGVHLTGTNTNIDIDADITGGTGTSLDVEGDATLTMDGNITNTAGRSLHVHNQTAGSIAVTGDITDTGTGLLFQNNSGGTTSLTGTTMVTTSGTDDAVTVANNSGGTLTINGLTADTTAGSGNALVVVDNTGGSTTFINTDIDTTSGQGVSLSNNTGATISFQAIDIETTTGAGFSATGGGTLTATGTNTIDTNTGTGLNLNGMTIAGTGMAFNSVSVNGATNGILLTDLTGGQTRVGAATATGTDGDGGTLLSTNRAIQVSGVTNAVFNDITVTSTTTDAITVNHTTSAASTVVFDNLSLTTSNPAANGITVTDNGSGELDFTLQNSTVDVSAANTIGFIFNSGANTGEVDIRLQNNTITAADNEALSVNIANGTGDIQFLLTGNTVENNSATDAAAEFLVTANRTLNATIGDQSGALPFDNNSFINSNLGGTAFTMESNGAVSSINLDLRDNIGFGGTADFVLTETAGTFGVVNRDTTFGTPSGNNNGDVDFGLGNVLGDFDNLLPPIKQVD